MRKEQTSHKNEHNTLMCFPLEPVFTRDKRRLPNFIDEPMNGLDPIGIAEMRGFLVKLSREQGKTILISSHILSEIELVADRVGIMDHGALLAQKNMKELKKGEETLETYFRNVTGGVGIA